VPRSGAKAGTLCPTTGKKSRAATWIDGAANAVV
jgi:hypothetical protein